jgi:hypothetical protein
MTKIKLVFVILAMAFAMFILPNYAKAQFAVSGNIGFNLPIDNQKVGYGAGIKGMYFVNPKFAVGASLQYLRFNYYWDVTLTTYSGFANYYFTESGFRPYIGADLGLYRYAWSYYYADDSYIGIAPTLGFLYDFNEQWALDMNAKYALLLSSGGLKLAPINIGVHYYISR